MKDFFSINYDDEDSKINDFKMFSINTLINIYNLIESICWNQFKDNLNNQYKLHLKDEVKKAIKDYLENSIKENYLIKKQDIANATRRLISRYLSGKRSDSDIGEYKKLFDYIQRADLWRADLPDNENFSNELYDIFAGINEVSKVDIECNEEDNKCENCSEMRKQGIQNPCRDCNNCNYGLRVGHALEFFELINEDKNEKEDNSENEEIINTKSSRIDFGEFDINTDSKRLNEEYVDKGEENKEEEEEKDENGNEDQEDEQEGEVDEYASDEIPEGEI